MTTTTFDPTTLLSNPLAGTSCPEVDKFVKSKRFHVTGGGGTIGRAVVAVLLEAGASEVVAIDRDEGRLGETCPGAIKVLEDVSNQYPNGHGNPDAVIHCAAYKHVDALEGQPLQATENNIIATGIVADWCRSNHTAMIYLSTDKAICPVGVLGLTKALGEHVARSVAGARVVRLVNVIGSSGSVIEKWSKAIAKGEALTVCNPNHLRHYMSERAAAYAVLSALIGPRLGMFIPQEYETMSTMELACRMLAIHGEPNVGYTVTQARPGERMVEPVMEPGHVIHRHVGTAAVTGWPVEQYSPQEVG